MGLQITCILKADGRRQKGEWKPMNEKQFLLISQHKKLREVNGAECRKGKIQAG